MVVNVTAESGVVPLGYNMVGTGRNENWMYFAKARGSHFLKNLLVLTDISASAKEFHRSWRHVAIIVGCVPCEASRRMIGSMSTKDEKRRG